MALTDVQVKNTKAGEKQRKISDEKGLYLLVTPKGGKLWRYKYRFSGKKRVLAIGIYLDISLARAREARDDARKLLAKGIDPNEYKKAVKLQQEEADANSFELIDREWYVKNLPNWAPSHSTRSIRRLENYIFPYLGKKAVSQVTAPELLRTLRRIKARGAFETAHRTLQPRAKGRSPARNGR